MLGRIFEVEDAAMIELLRTPRRMHQKRRHLQDLAGAAGTDFTTICAQRSDFIRIDATEAVTAGNHTKSAVVDTGVVKMQAQGDHALEKRRRSTGVGGRRP